MRAILAIACCSLVLLCRGLLIHRVPTALAEQVTCWVQLLTRMNSATNVATYLFSTIKNILCTGAWRMQELLVPSGPS